MTVVDVNLNILGSKDFMRNISCLSCNGRLINIGNCCSDTMDFYSYLPSLPDDKAPTRVIIAGNKIEYIVCIIRGFLNYVLFFSLSYI